jgi:hypothetical protein
MALREFEKALLSIFGQIIKMSPHICTKKRGGTEISGNRRVDIVSDDPLKNHRLLAYRNVSPVYSVSCWGLGVKEGV